MSRHDENFRSVTDHLEALPPAQNLSKALEHVANVACSEEAGRKSGRRRRREEPMLLDEGWSASQPFSRSTLVPLSLSIWSAFFAAPELANLLSI